MRSRARGLSQQVTSLVKIAIFTYLRRETDIKSASKRVFSNQRRKRLAFRLGRIWLSTVYVCLKHGVIRLCVQLKGREEALQAMD